MRLCGERKQEGKDQHSIIANPEFADLKSFDFRIRNRRLINKIGFKVFDYTKAGVYGSVGWIQQAKLDDTVAEAFDKMVAEHEGEAGN